MKVPQALKDHPEKRASGDFFTISTAISIYRYTVYIYSTVQRSQATIGLVFQQILAHGK